MNKIINKKNGLCGLVVALVIPTMTHAGYLEPTAPPESTASAVYKTDDIYNRLQTGTAGAKRAGAFSEPTTGPVDGVGKTLDEIMTAAPAMDNANGALPADVKMGKTYWGLRTDSGGTWGAMTGAATLTGGSNPAPVPKTGQLVSYDTGDDGAIQKGVTFPWPRFTNNGNGTVTDNLTGLIWLKDTNCLETVGGIAKNQGTLTWANALTWSSSLANGYCGLSDGSTAGDWRLPNKNELYSLVNDQYSAPTLSNAEGTGQWTDGDPFTNVKSDNYWTSTTYAAGTINAWSVFFLQSLFYVSDKELSLYVWPVRDGQ